MEEGLTHQRHATRPSHTEEIQSIGHLYRQYGRLVFALVLSVVRDPAVAEDLRQVTFVQALQQAARYDPARGSVAGWLLAIARSRAIDHLRTIRRGSVPELDGRERGDPMDTARGSEEMLLAKEKAAVLREAIDSLPVPQRLPLELAFYMDLTHREVAAILRQPLGTVKTRIRLGLEKLRTGLTTGVHASPQAEPSPFTVALAEYLSANPAAPQPRTATMLDGLRVLCVDDDRETLDLVCAVLESAGATVATACSVRTARERLRRAWPDLLLADLGMPVADGYMLIEEVKSVASATGRPLKAIALTARADVSDRVLNAGFAMHLRKPVDPGAIIAAAVALTRA